MISLLLVSLLAQTDGAHVLTARSPGDGVSRWAVAAHYVQAGDIPLPGLYAARHKGWGERTAWLSEFEASPRWLSAGTGFGVELTRPGGPLATQLRLSGTAFITNPGLLAFAAGLSLTSTTSLLLADLPSRPTLSLRLRYGLYVGSLPRLPRWQPEGRVALAYEQRLGGRWGLLAEVGVHLPYIGGAHVLARPVVSAGVSF